MSRRREENSTPRLVNLSATEVERRIAAAKKALAQVRELLPGLMQLHPDRRRRSRGKFRAEEARILASIVTAVEKHSPETFGFVSPGKPFDPDAVRADLARRAALLTLKKPLEELCVGVDDTILELGASARAAVAPLYRLALLIGKANADLLDGLANAREFYSGPVQARRLNAKRAKRKRGG